MNATKSFFLTMLVLLLGIAPLKAQKKFEGKIVYSIKVMGENADQMAAFMPESYTYLIKGTNLKFTMEGGMTAAMMGDFIVDGDEEVSYMVKHNEQTAYKMIPEEDAAEDEVVPEVTKLDETIEIAGYECQKYKVVTTLEGNETVQYMWMTEDIELDRSKNASKMRSGNIFVNGVKGFPLKIMTETMGMTMIMTASEVEEMKVDKKEFKIPSSYEIKDFDPQMFGGGMGR